MVNKIQFNSIQFNSIQELNLPSLLQNGRDYTSYNGAAVRFDKTQKKHW